MEEVAEAQDGEELDFEPSNVECSGSGTVATETDPQVWTVKLPSCSRGRQFLVTVVSLKIRLRYSVQNCTVLFATKMYNLYANSSAANIAQIKRFRNRYNLVTKTAKNFWMLLIPIIVTRIQVGRCCQPEAALLLADAKTGAGWIRGYGVFFYVGRIYFFWRTPLKTMWKMKK